MSIVVAGTTQGKSTVGGWLLVLCLLLLVWQPFSFALIASSMLVRLPARGLPLALILIARTAVVGCGIAAGLAFLGGNRIAVKLAQIALIAGAVVDVFVYATSYFPTNLPPGDAPFYIAASIIYSGAWLGYLARSKRVRGLL